MYPSVVSKTMNVPLGLFLSYHSVLSLKMTRAHMRSLEAKESKVFAVLISLSCIAASTFPGVQVLRGRYNGVRSLDEVALQLFELAVEVRTA